MRSGENLIGQVSGPNAAMVTEKMDEVKEKWAELETTIATRTKGRMIGRLRYSMYFHGNSICTALSSYSQGILDG